MAKNTDFQDSIMFGDEAAHIPTAKSYPKLCHITPPSYGGMARLSALWADIVHYLRNQSGKLTSAHRPQQAFSAASLSPAAKPLTADPLAYNSLGLPKPE